MHRICWICGLLILSLWLLAGCGGGLSLTGGSVPIGGRAVLPDGSTVSTAQVTVRALPSETVLKTSVTDSNGKFSFTGIPTNQDISILVKQSSTSSLEVVIPRAQLAAHPNQPLDIGDVTALTTIVAAAIHLEHGPAPEDSGGIVANQQGHLMMQVEDAHYSVTMQQQFINDPDRLNMEALTLIVPTANMEIAALAAQPTNDTASAALNGLLGYVRAAHMHGIHLSDTNRAALISAQLAGKVYSPDAIAAALKAANVSTATAAAVTSASTQEHAQLTALNSLGAGITPFEALVIASDTSTHGGFQLDQGPLETFLTQLLKP